MTMDATPRWGMPLLYAGQAQKEMFHNEALTLMDMLLHGQVASADLADPPGSPAFGRCWIVAADATGDWAGRAGSVACWTEGGWRFAAPRAGLSLWVDDRERAIWHDGVQWRDPMLRGDGLYVDGSRVVGSRMAAIADPAGGLLIDVDARIAIRNILLAMRTHGLIAE